MLIVGAAIVILDPFAFGCLRRPLSVSVPSILSLYPLVSSPELGTPSGPIAPSAAAAAAAHRAAGPADPPPELQDPDQDQR